MARFVSKYPKYSICVLPEKVRLSADGYPFVQQDARIADFVQGGLLTYEEQYAKDNLAGSSIGGALPEGIAAQLRYSVFDTEQQGYPEEVRLHVENTMRTSRVHGIDFIQVEKPKLAPPWPNYDAVSHRGPKPIHSVIADKVRDDGYDPEYVILYESENLNRADVIASLQALATPDDDEVLA